MPETPPDPLFAPPIIEDLPLREGLPVRPVEVKDELTPKQHRVLPLLRQRVFVSALDLANALGLTPRTMREICKQWVAEGFLVVADPSRRARMYKLGKISFNQWV